jgi:hypothetical protein
MFITIHFNSWHKYNLKRKIAQLPSVNAEQFAQKVLGKIYTFVFPLFDSLIRILLSSTTNKR